MESAGDQCKKAIYLNDSREQERGSEAENLEFKWNVMKEIWLRTSEQVCGCTKEPLRHH